MSATSGSQPWLHQHGKEIQAFGTVRQFPLGLSHDARRYSCQRLNQLLADTQILYAFYKKHHWLMRGATFYQLHLLLDKASRSSRSTRLPSGYKLSVASPWAIPGTSRRSRRIIADYLIAAGETVFHILGKDRIEPAR